MLVNYLYNQSIYFPIFSINFFPSNLFILHFSFMMKKKQTVATKVWLLVFVQYMLGNFL